MMAVWWRKQSVHKVVRKKTPTIGTKKKICRAGGRESDSPMFVVELMIMDAIIKAFTSCFPRLFLMTQWWSHFGDDLILPLHKHPQSGLHQASDRDYHHYNPLLPLSPPLPSYPSGKVL